MSVRGSGNTENSLVKPITHELSAYLKDESRITGIAESISFPKTREDVIALIKDLYSKGIPVTIQGARTGLTAGAVPQSGHIINLSRMDSVTEMRIDDKGSFYITVQAGTILSELRKQIKDKNFDISKWNAESTKTFEEFCNAPEQFFSPDPTETSATLGGMAACNASGACSYLYGSTRKHVTALKIVLCSGHTLTIRRGEIFASGRKLDLVKIGRAHV